MAQSARTAVVLFTENIDVVRSFYGTHTRLTASPLVVPSKAFFPDAVNHPMMALKFIESPIFFVEHRGIESEIAEQSQTAALPIASSINAVDFKVESTQPAARVGGLVFPGNAPPVYYEAKEPPLTFLRGQLPEDIFPSLESLQPSVVVFRTGDQEMLAKFFLPDETMWTREKHGKGPWHYAHAMDGCSHVPGRADKFVVEIYPVRKTAPACAVELFFAPHLLLAATSIPDPDGRRLVPFHFEPN